MSNSISISRRDLLRALAGAPFVASASSLFGQETPQSNSSGLRRNVVPTARCFLIGNQPEFLISGSLHYFRVPHELWRDRLLRAKRAGLNCIETYVAWNFHEPEQGTYRFTGDQDLEQFLRICRDCGLYVFLRPGPFICSEWDAGGYPAWLIGKKGVELRTQNPVAQEHIRRWFEQLIPRVAKHQVSHGGPVVLVQSENEYLFCEIPGGQEYLQFLIETLRELGIEVPITDCNGLNVRVPGSLKTVHGPDANDAATLREKFPDTPMFLGEFWIGTSLTFWNTPLQQRPVDEVRQATMEALANRAMYNFYMFHGGTNFGFWGSCSVNSDHSWMTTRYDFTSPIAEGGALNEKYFAVKSLNHLAGNFRNFFCEAGAASDPVSVAGPVQLRAWRSAQGYMLFILPRRLQKSDQLWRLDGEPPLMVESAAVPGELDHQPGVLVLPSGEQIELAEPSLFGIMAPYDLRLNSACHIDFANATVLGQTGEGPETGIILQGQAGRAGIVSINKERKQFVFPSGEPLRLAVGGVRVIALSQQLAERTWFADGRVLIGPAYVGEQENGRHRCWLDGSEKSLHVFSARGDYRKIEVASQPTPSGVFRPTGWKGRSLPEVAGAAEGWRQIGEPRRVEELGGYYGYTWYRASFHSDRSRESALFLAGAGDRIHIFSEARKLGVWGRGTGAQRGPIPFAMKEGENTFTFFCDNMGRSSEGQAQESKGIWGNAYVDTVHRQPAEQEWSAAGGPPRVESWQFKTYRCRENSPEFRFTRLRLTVPFQAGEGAVLSLRWVPQFVWVYVNGQFVGEHSGDEALANGRGFSEFVLDPYLRGQPADIELFWFGKPSKDIGDHVFITAYPLAGALTGWRFKTFETPTSPAKAEAGLPAWWECEFAKPPLPGPLFITTDGLSKGQIYLNQNPVGRYWTVGPQHSLYLPEPWIQEQNQLVILDEEGKPPDRVYLLRDSRLSTQSVLA